MEYPTILKALQHMRDNSELPQREITESEMLDVMGTTGGYPILERLLSKLAPGDLETLCIGDELEQKAVLENLGDSKDTAWKMLCELWDAYVQHEK